MEVKSIVEINGKLYRSYTFEECAKLVGTVLVNNYQRNGDDMKAYHLVTDVTEDGVKVFGINHSSYQLLNMYTKLDGTPVGMEVTIKEIKEA